MSKIYLTEKLSDSLRRMELHEGESRKRFNSEINNLSISGIRESEKYVDLGKNQKKILKNMISYIDKKHSNIPNLKYSRIINRTASGYIELLRFIQSEISDSYEF